MKVTKSQLKELIRHAIVQEIKIPFSSSHIKQLKRAFKDMKGTLPDNNPLVQQIVTLLKKTDKKVLKQIANADIKYLSDKAKDILGEEKITESKKRRYTVKEVRMWMKKLEENRYKKVYNSDARRVAWMVNNEGVELSEMPKSMSKKWTKAQYGRERYLAKEFLKSKSEQLSEGSLKKAMQQWKYIEKGLKPKQKKLVQKALKRLKPKMDKNFKNKDYQDYIDGELDIKVPLPDLMFGKGKEFGQLLSAYSNAIKEPAFYEGKLTETKFYAFYNKKKHTIDGKSLYDAKQKAITKLKVPKSKVGLLAIVNAKEHDRGGFRFEQKLRQTIREIIKEQLNEAPKPIHHSDMRMLYVPKKDFKNAVKLLRLNIKHGNVEVEKKPSDKVKGFYRFTTTKKMFDDVVTHLAMKKIGVKTIAKGKM